MKNKRREPERQTLEFHSWFNESIDPACPIWWVMYKLPLRGGYTQIDAVKALSLGYKLDPSTPTLEMWKKKVAEST